MLASQDYSVKKAAMVKAGLILSQVLKELKPAIKPGISTLELNNLAEKLIKQFGGEISFNQVPGYHWGTCMSVNEVIVHGVPNHYLLKKDDLLKLDIGVYLNGYHIDYGDSFYVGKPNKEMQQFMETGRKTLHKVIKMAQAGVHIGKVSQTIERMIDRAGYKVIYNLTGHAVGKKLHEDPLIPQFLDQPIKKTPVFQPGTAYALEIIYSVKDDEVVHANNDGWSLRTKKNSLSCCFENTVFIESNQTTVIVN